MAMARERKKRNSCARCCWPHWVAFRCQTHIFQVTKLWHTPKTRLNLILIFSPPSSLAFFLFSYCSQDQKGGISDRAKTICRCMNRWACDIVLHWWLKPNLSKTMVWPQCYVVAQDAFSLAHQTNYLEPTKKFQKEENTWISENTLETYGKMSSCYGKAAVGRRSEHRFSRFYRTKQRPQPPIFYSEILSKIWVNSCFSE